VSAPSSLAIATAERAGQLLIGFAREHGFNVYAGASRLQTSAV
jgi:formate dehydrogenase assembly factor FdhD